MSDFELALYVHERRGKPVTKALIFYNGTVNAGRLAWMENIIIDALKRGENVSVWTDQTRNIWATPKN